MTLSDIDEVAQLRAELARMKTIIDDFVRDCQASPTAALMAKELTNRLGADSPHAKEPPPDRSDSDGDLVSYDDDHPHWSPFDRAETAASDLRFALSMHGSKEFIRVAIGPNNYVRVFEYLDSIDKNLPILREHIRALALLAERFSAVLAPKDAALVARARADAGLVDNDSDSKETA